jgi:uncharacterized protein (DUF2147 family)
MMRANEGGRGLRRLRALALIAAVLGAAGGMAKEDQPKEAVYGIWATSGTMIEVQPVGDSLSARIIALKNPNWREKDGVGVIGERKTDLHNPDDARHEHPLIGLEMLSGYRFSGGRWQGKLYLPSNGTTWTSSARIKGGELQIRGYIGVSMLGKTQSFAPLASCNENILRMIRNMAMSDTPCDDLLAASAR